MDYLGKGEVFDLFWVEVLSLLCFIVSLRINNIGHRYVLVLLITHTGVQLP